MNVNKDVNVNIDNLIYSYKSNWITQIYLQTWKVATGAEKVTPTVQPLVVPVLIVINKLPPAPPDH